MRADIDGDGQPRVGRQCLLRQPAQVVGRDDVDAGERPFLDLEAIGAGVEAVLRVEGKGNARGNGRTAIELGEDRHRQVEEVHGGPFPIPAPRTVIADFNRINGMVEGMAEPLLHLRVVTARRQRDPRPVVQQTRHDRQVVAAHPVKQQRGRSLVHQRRDMPDIDRFAYVNQLAGVPQIVQKSPEALHPAIRSACS